MISEYKQTKHSLSYLRYHFVFCSRYRRKVFDIPGFKERFTELVAAECERLGIDVLKIDFGQDYVHILVDALPDMTIRKIISQIKAVTTVTLREEFIEISKMTALWTLNYLVSTAPEISQELIQDYVNMQKKHPRVKAYNMDTKEFEKKLRSVPDSYDGFLAGVLSYVKKKESRLKVVEEYMDKNPDALTSDILEFISDQDDFYEDTIRDSIEDERVEEEI